MSKKKILPTQLFHPLMSLPKITDDDFKFKKVLSAFFVLLGVNVLFLTILTSAQLFYYPPLCPSVTTGTVHRQGESNQQKTNRRSTMNLGEVAVGKTFAPDGRVAKNERIFTNRDATISLSVELIGSETNREVLVSLYSLDPRFPDNRTVAASQSAIITTEDQDVVQFEFHRPEKSWPTLGKYQALVEIPDSGARKTVHFAIYR